MAERPKRSELEPMLNETSATNHDTAKHLNPFQTQDNNHDKTSDNLENETPETIALNGGGTERETHSNGTVTARDQHDEENFSSQKPLQGKAMTYDNVLTSLGEFGRYQKIVFAMFFWATAATALQMLMTIFTLAVPKHRCAIPGMANDTWRIQSDLHASLVNLSIPPGDLEPYSSCLLYSDVSRYHGNVSLAGSGYYFSRAVNESQGLEEAGSDNNGYSPVSVGDDDTTECDRYVYDTSLYTSTFTTEMNLVCGRNLYRSHAQMMLMVGCLVGSQLGGVLADIWGRRLPLLVSLTVNVCLVFSMACVQNYVLLMVLMFLTGVTLLAIFGITYVLSLELGGASKRLWPGVGYGIAFSFGMILLALFAYFFRDWQHLQLMCASLTVPHLAFWCFTPESPRWLLSRGRVEDAKVMLHRMARVNKVTLRLDDLEKLEIMKEVPLWKSCYSARSLTGRHLIIFFAWCVASMTYYGLSLNAGQLVGSVYLNVMLMGVMEIVALSAGIFLLDRCGRRLLGSFWYLLAGASCTLTLFPVLFAPPDKLWVTTMLALVGKFGITGAFSVIWIHTSELFPTVMRNSGMGTSSLCARIGGIVAPYIANMDAGGAGSKAIPLVIFGVPAIVVSILLFCLPETRGRRLPETVQDAMEMGREKKTKAEKQKV